MYHIDIYLCQQNQRAWKLSRTSIARYRVAILLISLIVISSIIISTISIVVIIIITISITASLEGAKARPSVSPGGGYSHLLRKWTGKLSYAIREFAALLAPSTNTSY